MNDAPSKLEIAAEVRDALQRMGVKSFHALAVGAEWIEGAGSRLVNRSPIDGSVLSEFPEAAAGQIDQVCGRAVSAFQKWRMVPAPVRGELVRRIAQQLRQHKRDLALVVSAECGKITSEALGEVQEMIDIADFAVGLSRQLYGLTMASERPGHRLSEQWHPLGPIGVISAFNFPVAVWSWNAMLALVCGDSIIWKPSEKTPLSAIAAHQLVVQCMSEMPEVPADLLQLAIGGAEVGQSLAAHDSLRLISATGSVPMGRSVAVTVARRLGRSLLELGGNNAAIIAPTANLELTLRALVFSAVGTCGQRCTSLRRILVHESLYESVLEKMLAAFQRIRIGHPLDPSTLIGPLIDEEAFDRMQLALRRAGEQGGHVYGGGRVRTGVPAGGYYVEPALVEIAPSAPIIREETFAPLAYVMKYRSIEEAIEHQNSVPQGLSSSIFTRDIAEAELFCSAQGSDCGMANVNVGTSGAEIGGAFGGEKETGGGRESGSDAWKNYMRRCTNTINFTQNTPLAQGVSFDIE